MVKRSAETVDFGVFFMCLYVFLTSEVGDGEREREKGNSGSRRRLDEHSPRSVYGTCADGGFSENRPILCRIDVHFSPKLLLN